MYVKTKDAYIEENDELAFSFPDVILE